MLVPKLKKETDIYFSVVFHEYELYTFILIKCILYKYILNEASFLIHTQKKEQKHT